MNYLILLLEFINPTSIPLLFINVSKQFTYLSSLIIYLVINNSIILTIFYALVFLIYTLSNKFLINNIFTKILINFLIGIAYFIIFFDKIIIFNLIVYVLLAISWQLLYEKNI